ncbi:malto-oligosyltrehalose synthase, partial [Cronobacter malonaticus]
QTALKLTAPGVPDIYQGSEALNFSLVDPDNRREPDFIALDSMLAPQANLTATSQDWISGRLKQHLIARVLHLRQQNPALFRHGDYLPLHAEGEFDSNVIAYARTHGDDAIIVIAPRLMFTALYESASLPARAGWHDTQIMLPPTLAQRRWRNVLTGETVTLADRMNLETADGCSSVILITD